MPANEAPSPGKQHPGEVRLEDLIATAKAGSDSALGEAFSVCRPTLLQTARRQLAPGLRPFVGASDIVQDAFANATRAFPLFRGERPGQFLHWLRRILFNRIAQIVRSQPQRRQTADRQFSSNSAEHGLSRLAAPDVLTPSRIASDGEDADLIRAGIARLSPRDQQALDLRFGEGLSFAEIGERLALNEKAARMVFTRAVDRLSHELRFDGRKIEKG